MGSLDTVHRQLLDEWRQESKRDLSEIAMILKSAKEGEKRKCTRNESDETNEQSSQMEAEHRRLMAEWNKQSKDLGAIGTALKQLKDLMNNADALRGDVYEIEVLSAILNSDLEAFHEAISVLISFYQSYSLNKEWPNKWLMIGLNLMYLLATKQHAQFHMVCFFPAFSHCAITKNSFTCLLIVYADDNGDNDYCSGDNAVYVLHIYFCENEYFKNIFQFLEQIDQDVQQNNPYIWTPVKLEQSLMEGAYNKLMLTEKNIPSPYYAPFIRIAMDSVRDEIASCMECSFVKVSQEDAAQLLLFNDVHEVIPFAEKIAAEQRQFLDTKRTTKQAIFYAKQLEMIV
ncbi:unnamed protein product [Gongylonema pulchrum]|uniref:CSN8_PSD8_EIF3K domain-containing protein n=1 Tax=Gongylonema pulchrum TaxID=637853 RepID=A0A183DXL4_9BILA|nr:unnamed protein product [Gongylonema pulchrum]